MTKRQLTKLCKNHGLTSWQHKAAQILYSVNGSDATRNYVEALVKEKEREEET